MKTWIAVVVLGVYAWSFDAAADPGAKALAVGHVTVNAPPGWQGVDDDGNLVFSPARGGDEISAMVSEGNAPARSPRELVDQSWAALSSAMSMSGAQLGQIAKTAAGYELLIATGKARVNGEDSTIAVAAVMGRGAQALVVVVAKDGKTFQRHGTAIGALIDSIMLDGGTMPEPDSGAAAATAVPAASATGPADFPLPKAIAGMGQGAAGAWAVLRTGARASVSSMTGVDLSAQWDVFVLLPDGRYSTRLHPEGLNWKSAADLEAKWPQYWGSYRVVGKNVTLTTGNGIVSTYELRGNLMVPTGRTSGSDMVRADTGADLRISGSFARYNIGSSTFGDQVPTVVFHRDGTFEDRYQGVYTVLQQGAKEWTGASARGRYRIHHNTLYLAYDDGRRIFSHIAILPTGGTREEPKGLYVGDFWMTRR